MFVLLSVFCTLSYAQTGNLTGVVLSEKGEGLIGATVKLKGTATGGACDLDGKYTIMNIPVGEQTFVISYIGFIPKEVKIDIKAGDNIQPAIVLKEDRMQLNEVVVVGYGTQVKHDMSSAAAEVKAADLADKPVDNFVSALAGADHYGQWCGRLYYYCARAWYPLTLQWRRPPVCGRRGTDRIL